MKQKAIVVLGATEHGEQAFKVIRVPARNATRTVNMIRKDLEFFDNHHDHRVVVVDIENAATPTKAVEIVDSMIDEDEANSMGEFGEVD
jgi:hypothetical protein